jgi:hypothetical protein
MILKALKTRRHTVVTSPLSSNNVCLDAFTTTYLQYIFSSTSTDIEMASPHNWNLSTAHASIIRGERVAPTVYDHFPSDRSTWLGIAQIVCTLGTISMCVACFGYFGIAISLGLQFPLMVNVLHLCHFLKR